MDNIGKALQMGGAVFMFIIAISVAIYLYSGLMSYCETVAVVSDYNNRAEHVILADSYSERKASDAEIIMTLININNVKDTKVKITYNDGSEKIFKSCETDDDCIIKLNGSYEAHYSIEEYDFMNLKTSSMFEYSYENESNTITYKEV